jgi:hypothetical protein
MSCVDCPAGYYSDKAAAVACEQCDLGRYAATAGTATCLVCGSGYGTGSGYGNTECYICTEGKASSSTYWYCYSCWYGTYSVGEANDACSSCPTGTYQDGRTQNSCKNCAIGTYAHQTATRYCIACEAGRYGATTALSDCTNCTAGKYSFSSSSSCQNCPSGAYSFVGAKICVYCNTGRYSASSGSPDCTDCPKVSEIPIACCGPLRSCWLCRLVHSCSYIFFLFLIRFLLLQGHYSTSEGGFAKCIGCPKGEFTNATASTTCDLCAAGKVIATLLDFVAGYSIFSCV